MNVYVARQPIFNRRLQTCGYELLYRRSNQNVFPGGDDDEITEELIYNSLLVMGLNHLTNGTKAFINFSKGMISGHVPYLLPKKDVVIEILEREQATCEMEDACKKLRSMGYTLALDDFVPNKESLALIHLVDIVKVEYPVVDCEVQHRLIQKFGSKVKFLAEKIETRADYQHAYNMGYQYFQGYFFSKPAVMNSADISSLNINLIRIMEEIKKEEPSYPVISSIIEQDVGLSYKLLRLVNSAYFASGQQIKSIQSALAVLGTQEISRWISMMMFKRIQNVQNAEMLKLSLIRGKHMELLAAELNDSENAMEYFFTGVFSFIDVLLNRPMILVLQDLSLPDRTRAALLGQDNPLRQILNCALDCEQAHWDGIEQHYPINRIGMQRYMDLYFQALKWAQQLNY